MKVIVLSRLWDNEEQGFQTVERIATNMTSIINYIEKGYTECDFKYLMSENYDDKSIVITIKKFIINKIDDVVSTNNIGQYFLKVIRLLDGETLDIMEFRVQIRNVHED